MRIIDISEDGMSFVAGGEPLTALQLQNAVIVDNETGKVRAALEGFYILWRESTADSLRRAIPPGCHLWIS